MYDFLFVITELFSLALTAEMLHYRRKSVDVSVLKGGGSLRSPIIIIIIIIRKFITRTCSQALSMNRRRILGGRGRHPPTTVRWQKTRRIALSCGIKISPVGS